MQRALVSLFSKIRPFEKKRERKKMETPVFHLQELRNAQDNNLLRRKYCYKKNTRSVEKFVLSSKLSHFRLRFERATYPAIIRDTYVAPSCREK